MTKYFQNPLFLYLLYAHQSILNSFFLNFSLEASSQQRIAKKVFHLLLSAFQDDERKVFLHNGGDYGLMNAKLINFWWICKFFRKKTGRYDFEHVIGIFFKFVESLLESHAELGGEQRAAEGEFKMHLIVG